MAQISRKNLSGGSSGRKFAVRNAIRIVVGIVVIVAVVVILIILILVSGRIAAV